MYPLGVAGRVQTLNRPLLQENSEMGLNTVCTDLYLLSVPLQGNCGSFIYCAKENIWATPLQNQQNECSPSEDSDQPWHPPSLIRVFIVRTMGSQGPSFLHVDSEDSDQTGQMPRLIWVFAGHTVTLLFLSCRSSFLKAVSTLETVSARAKCNTCIITYNKIFNTLMNWLMCCAVRNAKITPFLPKYWVTKESALSTLNATGPYTHFWKGGCKFKSFYKGGASLKKILILRPKLWV